VVPPTLVVTVDDVDRRRCATSIVTGGRIRCGRRCRVAVDSVLLRGVAAAMDTSGGRRPCRRFHLLVGGLLLHGGKGGGRRPLTVLVLELLPIMRPGARQLLFAALRGLPLGDIVIVVAADAAVDVAAAVKPLRTVD